MFTQLTRGVPASRITTLRRIPMFAGLSDHALARIDSHMSETTLPAGAALMQQGDPAREACIVADGRALILVDGRPIGTASVGDLVGETALLDGGSRTATVIALTDLRVYVLDPSEFATLFDDPATARWIATRLAERLRASA
jgi:CRP-like cAMP-binding protein